MSEIITYDMTQMAQMIKNIQKKYNIYFEDIEPKYFNIIINLFDKQTINYELCDFNDPYICFLTGSYYGEIEKNYDQMKKYYLMAIDLGNSDAMNNLAYYYYTKDDFEKMEKYYLMAIELGNSNAMKNLATYYYEKNNFEKMEKYYLMAIELGNCYAMNSLATFYYNKHDFTPLHI
jgi:TPR repeat protein